MSKRTPPNILFILSDQQRNDTLGVHGNPLDLTPNIDAMALRGTCFKHAYSPQPLCTPARACLQTGMYSTSNGSFTNGQKLDNSLPTIANVLNEQGYQTGYIGKWHLSNSQAVKVSDRAGYRYWLAANSLEMCSGPYDLRLYNEACEQKRFPGYRVDGVTDAAIRFIDNQRDQKQPFFLFVSYLEPHFQNNSYSYPAPEVYKQRYQGAQMPPDLQALSGSAAKNWGGYCGMIKRIDESVGRLNDALISLNMKEDTLIIFTSDHGDHFETRNHFHKSSVHESSCNVPLVIDGPGFECGGLRNELVSLLDLPPTILDAANAAIPNTFQGKILHEQISAPDKDDATILIQVCMQNVGIERGLRTKRWKYGISARDIDDVKATDGTAIIYEERYLYDLENDPYELENLISLPQFQTVRDALRARLTHKMAAIGEPTPQIFQADIEPNPAGVRTQYSLEIKHLSDKRPGYQCV